MGPSGDKILRPGGSRSIPPRFKPIGRLPLCTPAIMAAEGFLRGPRCTKVTNMVNKYKEGLQQCSQGKVVSVCLTFVSRLWTKAYQWKGLFKNGLKITIVTNGNIFKRPHLQSQDEFLARLFLARLIS